MKDTILDGIGFNTVFAASLTEAAFIAQIGDSTKANRTWAAKTPEQVEADLRTVHQLATIAVHGNSSGNITETGSGDSEPDGDIRGSSDGAASDSSEPDTQATRKRRKQGGEEAETV